MKHHILTFLAVFCIVFISCPTARSEDLRQMILVCNKNLEIESLSSSDVKKLFIGIPVTIQNIRLEALRNYSDEILKQVFLQKVMFMSEREYERRVVSNIFRTGNTGPDTYGDLTDLVRAIRENPESVTYIWLEDLDRFPELKSLGTVWTGSIN